MQFKEYPSYKASGVEWLGDVPNHWNLKRFGYIFDENKKKNIGLKEINVLSLSYGNIKEKNIDDNKGLLPESFETYQIIKPNDIVFRFTDLQNDKRSLRSAISKYHGIITSAYISVTTKQNADFYNYLFRAYDLQKVFYSMGEGMRQSLKMDELNKMPVVLPNKDEQKHIVSFLDTETARINNLISKQEKLIELLEEQRKSIISHAVTKGLNPNAPMKDSGVEWLGNVPEHWELTPIKHLVKTQKGFAFSSHLFKEDDNGIGITKASDIKNGSILEASTFIDKDQFDEYKKYQLYTDDIIISTVGSTPEVSNSAVGQIGLLPEDLEGCLLNQNTVIFRSKPLIDQVFLYYTLLSKAYRNYLDLFAHGTANQASLSIVDMLAFSLPLPPKNEQSDIVLYIKKKSFVINRLIHNQKQLIEKLKEYRSSIISHAVTGKIDVRELST
ncbi:restriction endonuclease subunit S [Acinetobacter sp. IK40]|jgi:type I restriction enzyme, S subunit|uniref:restriction endonuclease subunit S n=1 Tax=Acinetobacter sp. IK40 TaxID=2928897 RepID=UPI002D1E9B7C|nr:restriction endonuclease subunit S [Acinetobacter sp. IK40]MEB3791270.1 restriction endonuclease subunit S [Acinetobacter sp. IK40]